MTSVTERGEKVHPAMKRVLDFLAEAKPGETLVYHRGHLASDRAQRRWTPDGAEYYTPVEPLDSIAHLAMTYATYGYEGLGGFHLTQKRVVFEGESTCEYRMTRKQSN